MERAVGRAAHVELLVPREQELAPNARARRARPPPISGRPLGRRTPCDAPPVDGRPCPHRPAGHLPDGPTPGDSVRTLHICLPRPCTPVEPRHYARSRRVSSDTTFSGLWTIPTSETPPENVLGRLVSAQSCIAFTWRYSSSANLPSSRPCPDCL